MFDKPEEPAVRLIVLLFLSLLYYGQVQAGSSPQIRSQPAWILPSDLDPSRVQDPKNISNGYYLELSDHQVNLVSQTEFVHFIRHITNESGVQDASEVSVRFAPEYQQLVFHRVDVIRNGKSTSQLNSSSIKTTDEETEASNFEYNGKKRAYIILKDIRKGDRIEVSYSVTGFNPVFKGRYSDYFYFYNESPVLNYYLRILTRPGQLLHFKEFNHAPAPSIGSESTYTFYQWKNPGIVTSMQGANTPSWFTTLPYIYFSEFGDWKEVNDWALDIFNLYQYPLPEKLLTKISEWRRAAAGDPDHFTNLALRFVQDQVRYLALEMGANSHKPHTPSDVFSHRFGDCKDKSLLLVMILRHENIEAYVALTNPDEREMQRSAAMTPLAFNHAIVALKRSGGYLFLDPTISMQRGELANNFIPAYGVALVIRPGNQDLTPVVAGPKRSYKVTENLQVSLEDTSYFQVTSIYQGGQADEVRLNLSESSSEELKQSYLKYYQKLLNGILPDSVIQISDDSLKNILQVSEFYKIPNLWRKKDNASLQFDLSAKIISDKFPDPSQQKKGEPLAIDYPVTLDYILRVELPEEWPMDTAQLHIKNEAFQFDFTPVSSGSRQVFKYYFKTFRDYIRAEDMDQYKADYQEIEKCMSLWFTKNNSVPTVINTPSIQPEKTLNWKNIWLSFVFGVGLTILFNFLNKKRAPVELLPANSPSYDGWMIFLFITLLIRAISQCIVMVKVGCYNQAIWIQLGKSGGPGLQGIIEFVMFVSLFSLAGSLALCYWFTKKRDIFPRMFMYYSAVYVAAHLILLYAYYMVPVTMNMKETRNAAAIEFSRGLVYSAIWVGYLAKSERIKQIFVRPFS
jgi:transglutaminase-like putative cysteine protease